MALLHAMGVHWQRKKLKTAFSAISTKCDWPHWEVSNPQTAIHQVHRSTCMRPMYRMKDFSEMFLLFSRHAFEIQTLSFCPRTYDEQTSHVWVHTDVHSYIWDCRAVCWAILHWHGYNCYMDYNNMCGCVLLNSPEPLSAVTAWGACENSSLNPVLFCSSSK